MLATLDPTFTESQEIADRERLDSMRRKRGGSRPRFTEAVSADRRRQDPLDAKYLKLQAAVYAHRQAEYRGRGRRVARPMPPLEAALSTNREAQAGPAGTRSRSSPRSRAMREELFNLSAGSQAQPAAPAQLDRL